MLGSFLKEIIPFNTGYLVEAVTRQQVFRNVFLPILIIAVLAVILILFYPWIFPLFLRGLSAVNGAFAKLRKKIKGDSLDDTIKQTGFDYDPKQDIFYSSMDAWQRKIGYCRLYDETAAPLSMIIDCEPIHFEYDGKNWLIELWKGQYGMTTGGEIGVFTTEGPIINIPGVFNGTFYNSASSTDLLYMSYALIKYNKTLFTREDKHWWLTGFVLGEFSEPSELIMNINITLKNQLMCHAFLKGLSQAGYADDEITVGGNTVSLIFSKAHTLQPVTRTPATDWIIQRKNELLCDKYQEVTKGIDDTLKKLKVIKKKAPDLYDEALNIRKTKQLFETYRTFTNYMK